MNTGVRNVGSGNTTPFIPEWPLARNLLNGTWNTFGLNLKMNEQFCGADLPLRAASRSLPTAKAHRPALLL